MSRKMLFASGLLACFACEMGIARPDHQSTCSTPPLEPEECVDCLRSFLEYRPLDIVATYFLRLLSEPKTEEAAAEAARLVFDSYNSFLGLRNDSGRRSRVEDLSPSQMADDEEFLEARNQSHALNRGLLTLFFDLDTHLGDLTKFYGVF